MSGCGGGVLMQFSTGNSPGDPDCSSQALRNGTLDPWRPGLYAHLHVRLSTAATECVLLLAPRSGDHERWVGPAASSCGLRAVVCFSLVCNLQGAEPGEVRSPAGRSAARCHLLRCRGRAAGRRGPGHGCVGTWQGPAGSQLCPSALPTPGQLETAELWPIPSSELWPRCVGEDRRMCGAGCLSVMQGTENSEWLAKCTGLEAAFSSEGWSWCLCPSCPVAFPLSAPVLLKSPRPRGCQTVPAEAAAFSCSPSTFCRVPKLPGIFQRTPAKRGCREEEMQKNPLRF